MNIVNEQIKNPYSNLQLLIFIGSRHEIWAFYDCGRKHIVLQGTLVPFGRAFRLFLQGYRSTKIPHVYHIFS